MDTGSICRLPDTGSGWISLPRKFAKAGWLRARRLVSIPKRSLGIDQHATAIGMPDLNFNAPALPGQAELLRSALRQLAPVEIWRRCCAISRTEAGPMSELLSPCTLKTVG